jgi:hypothetical protein
MRYFEADHSELACIAPSPLRGEGWGEGPGPLSKHELVMRQPHAVGHCRVGSCPAPAAFKRLDVPTWVLGNARRAMPRTTRPRR